MELPNSYFTEFPIEFKKLNEEDFSDLFTVSKTELEIEEGKYLNDIIQDRICLSKKATTVINAPVGNGKTYAIIQTVKRFYEASDDYLIFIASPFVSLVEQYYQSVLEIEGVTESNAYNYNNIGRNNIKFVDKSIQIVTVNTLLGNPGEDSYKNSDAKRFYLKTLLNKCVKEKKKVVFIFDEIHDSFQNFKEEFVFSLWNWHDVIHQNYIISATYNEASKVVIEYLAELTDRTIDIIEVDRKIDFKNLSKLYLHYSSEYHFTNNTKEIRDIIGSILDKNMNLDILCYSKTLSKSIISDEVLGPRMVERFGEINDCTSENIDNQRPENKPQENRFDNSKCNIGTNFKSGVSIEKDNHAFIIVLPPRSSQSIFKNNYGIFSGGINSIVQAIARKRKKGEIHIVLPRPNKFNYDSLSEIMSSEKIEIFRNWYQEVEYYKRDYNSTDLVEYKPLNTQLEALNQFYTEKLKKYVQKGIDLVQSLDRGDLARLDYPNFKNFVLNRGENYLSDSVKFWGGDLSAYVTYCAFTNQFVNCKLEKFNYKTILIFKQNNLQRNFIKYFEIYFGSDYYNSFVKNCSFSTVYHDIRNKFFNEFSIKLSRRNKNNIVVLDSIKPYNSSLFETQLLRFVGLLYYGDKYYDSIDYKYRKNDIDFSRQKYFLAGISCSIGIDIENFGHDEILEPRIRAFKNLNYFREKLIDNISEYSRGASRFKYLPVKPFDSFMTSHDLPKFLQLVSYFRNNDTFVNNRIYEFIRGFNYYSMDKRITAFYTMLLDDFFVFEERNNLPKISINGTRKQVKPILKIMNLSCPKRTIDLISIGLNSYNEDYISVNDGYVLDKYGDWENYFKIISESISN